jgi:hypothetical protein
VQREDFGYYVCKAINDAGDVTTRGKLIESSEAFMTPEEIEKNREKTEKRLAKKGKTSRRSSKTDAKFSSSVNVEATVRSSKKSETKTIGESNVDASASFKTKKVKEVVKAERNSEESSELTITQSKDVYIQETEETFIREVEHKTCHTTITINNLQDIENIRSSNDIENVMKQFESKDFGKNSDAVKDLVTINFMLQNGLSTADVQKLFNAKYFPNIVSTEVQSALVQLLERKNHSSFVSEVLAEKSENEIDENFLSSVGLRAFLKMNEAKNMEAKDIMLALTPDDFASTNWKNMAKEV